MEKNVVVVDDEEDLCQMVEISLRIRNQDIRVHKAHDGEAGLALIKRVRPDLVILDVKMPKANGYEVLSRLRADADLKDTPVMMMTSLTEGSAKADIDWGKSLGVQAFFTKPYETQAMLAEAERLLGLPAAG